MRQFIDVIVVVIGTVCLRIFDYDNDNDRKPSSNICTAALEQPRHRAGDENRGLGLAVDQRPFGTGKSLVEVINVMGRRAEVPLPE